MKYRLMPLECRVFRLPKKASQIEAPSMIIAGGLPIHKWSRLQIVRVNRC